MFIFSLSAESKYLRFSQFITDLTILTLAAKLMTKSSQQQISMAKNCRKVEVDEYVFELPNKQACLLKFFEKKIHPVCKFFMYIINKKHLFI